MASKKKSINEIEKILKINEFLIIKAPRLSQFKSKKEADSPYFKFFHWLRKKINYKEPLDVTTVWLHPQDAKKLDKYALDWIKSQKYGNKKMNEQAFGYHSLVYSPSVFTEDKIKEKEIESGYIYISPTFFSNGDKYEDFI